MTSFKLLLKSLLFCLIMILLIIVSYFYIDRNLATWINQHVLVNLFFNLSIKIPVVFYLFSGVSLITLAFFSMVRPLKAWEKTLIVAAVSQYCAMGLKVGMKYFFGRYTPGVYFSEHLYGFNFFHDGMKYYSFPSGHTTAIVSYLAVIWIRHNRMLKGLVVVLSCCVGISLIALNMHYLSDVLAAIMLGIMMAIFSNQLILNQTKCFC
ncbi:phosphatidylglycerophosphatase B [Piscirickettsia salmonis]|uniref:phosphatase PAP2 family protein n=1 Tax=Piscirickettsia salmonis TaxID=1238 RepID=UPI0012BA2191|nr:phosphatase PAP2 family protein [Piscirickettsia salmonis]QGP48690.1 phosphatidylglycerophosphatase B [Piscirickettsia salmonis]QGP52722.1 phosphatidylglycerophosphatase B [Piscirickettsia salmonis]